MRDDDHGTAAVLVQVPALPGVEVLAGRHAESRFAPHWHTAWSLAAIAEGTCRFGALGRRWEAPPGSLVLIPPHAVHSAGIAEDGLRMTMIYLPQRTAARLLGLPGHLAPRLAAPVLGDAPLAARLHAAFAAADGRILEETCGLALRRFLDAAGGATAPLRRPDLEDARIGLVCGALRQAESVPDLDALAAAIGVSRAHFQRFFKRVVGLTPAEYARLCRLEKAKAALRTGTPVAEAALQAGFADQAHLTRWFRAVYGTTPSRVQ